MRQLDKKEREITQKSIENLKKEVKSLKSTLDYNLDLIQLQKVQRANEDKWRDFKRQEKDDSDTRVIKQIEDGLKHSKEQIEMLTKQLNEGVEEKKHIGVQ